MYGLTKGEVLGGPIKNLYNFVEKKGTVELCNEVDQIILQITLLIIALASQPRYIHNNYRQNEKAFCRKEQLVASFAPKHFISTPGNRGINEAPIMQTLGMLLPFPLWGRGLITYVYPLLPLQRQHSLVVSFSIEKQIEESNRGSKPQPQAKPKPQR